MPNFDHVSITCFFASYLIALGLELSQFLRPSRMNRWVAIGFSGAGLLAHTIYLVHRSRISGLPPLVGSMHDWMLVLAWGATATYLALELRNSRLGLGVFLLPLVLLLVGSSTRANAEKVIVRDNLYAVKMLHASLLVFGIAGVAIAFLLSLMYLVQHNRLKHKSPDPESLQLFSLERLNRMNRWAVSGSVPLLTIGMAAGVWMAWQSRSGAKPINLAAPGFIVMGLLWLGMISLFGWLFSRQQSSGKIVAWRTLWACGFLIVTMICLEVFTEGIHGKKTVERAHWPVRPGEPILVVSLRDLAHAGHSLFRPHLLSAFGEIADREAGRANGPVPHPQLSTLNPQPPEVA